jgi:hypothetical protein
MKPDLGLRFASLGIIHLLGDHMSKISKFYFHRIIKRIRIETLIAIGFFFLPAMSQDIGLHRRKKPFKMRRAIERKSEDQKPDRLRDRIVNVESIKTFLVRF